MSDATHAADLDRSLRYILRNGVGIQIMETLAVGAFLTAFALQKGASNFVIGLLAAIPHLSQLAQFPFVSLVDRWRNRRRVYLIAGWIARPMLLLIAVAAFLPPGWPSLTLICGAFAVRYMGGAGLAVAWNSWMRDLVPEKRMGEVFGARARVMTGIGIATSLAAAAFVDNWQRVSGLADIYGYAVIYTLAFAGGAYSVWSSRHIVEPPMAPAEDGMNLFARLRAPLQDRNFRRLLRFLVSWSFAVNLAAPFFTVNMLKELHLPVTWVVFLGVLSQLASFFAVRSWGAIADRFNNKAVLSVCGPAFIGCIFAWTFATMPDTHDFTIPLLVLIHVLTGVAAAGVSLASGNISLKLAPRGSATAYLATSSVLNASAAALASIVGGLTADFFAERELSLTLHWESPVQAVDLTALSITSWDFFFAIAAVIGLYSLHRLSLVEEHGEVHERVVLEVLFSDARRGVRNLSTIAGLRAATDFPIELLRRAIGRRRRGRRDDVEDADDEEDG
jgi:MFS family permease